jgi:hypothetical protein
VNIIKTILLVALGIGTGMAIYCMIENKPQVKKMLKKINID